MKTKQKRVRTLMKEMEYHAIPYFFLSSGFQTDTRPSSVPFGNAKTQRKAVILAS